MPEAQHRAKARIASTPWLPLPLLLCGTLVRQEPNASCSGRPGASVRITEGGNPEPVSGHTSVPPISTV